jgi:hypothetical protein
VRWPGAGGLLLRWLYPNFRFVVLVRHPAAAYQALRNCGPAPSYEGVYVRMWNELTFSWLAVGDRLGAHLVR